MNNRLKLGINFNFDPSWMGGIIYIINVVRILNYLDDNKKPEIFIFFRTDLKRFTDEFNYPYIHFVESRSPSFINGTIKSLLFQRNVFVSDILSKYPLDVLFPLFDFPVREKTKTRLLSWYADMQHKHYPEFFSRLQIWGRNIRTKFIIHNCDEMILSSNDVLNDFIKYHTIPKNLHIHIFHFASVVDHLNNISIEEIKSKYNIGDEYFIVSNQFHQHKNHKVVLLALAKLKEMGILKYIVFTGKFPRYTDSPYLKELHEIIEKNSLHFQVFMLGVISRNEQLLLMKHSQAVIQPSLFEGWSTVIEDAKSLQVPVIASNIAVNIEQLTNTGSYFNPHNYDELAQIIKNLPHRSPEDILYEPYEDRIHSAAENLLNIFNNGH